MDIRLGIRAWLLLLALFAAFPLLLFSVFTVRELELTRQRAVTTELVERTGAMANAVEQRLAGAAGYLTALANSDAALGNDLPALYEHARRLMPMNPDVTAITLIGPKGEQIFNTLMPLGTALPLTGAPEAARRVFDTGRPVVSGPFTGTVSDAQVTSLGVPVVINGRVVYCLRMVIRVAVFNELLRAQGLSAEWTASIVDSAGIYVARTRSPELMVGKRAPPSLLAAIRKGDVEVFDTFLGEGVSVKGTFTPLTSWGWTVAAAVPTDALNAPLRHSLVMVALGGAFLLTLGIAAAFGLSAHLVRQVARVGAASAAVGRGEHPVLPPTLVREFDELGQVLGLVNEREHQQSAALADAVVAHQQVSAELSMARCDHLTGLPGRALILELMEAMRANAAAQGGRQLALLFIDLDGFKQVNDLLGHDRGDEVLRQTARILRDIIRDADAAGRLGGDEFVVCVTAPAEATRATAAGIAARIVQQVGAIGGGIGCSIGISIWPGICPDIACVLKRADEAMYEAKRLGKNRFVVYGADRLADGSPWKQVAPEGCGC
jgi:diguanylate cyclase (GGDEF)-like protein